MKKNWASEFTPSSQPFELPPPNAETITPSDDGALCSRSQVRTVNRSGVRSSEAMLVACARTPSNSRADPTTPVISAEPTPWVTATCPLPDESARLTPGPLPASLKLHSPTGTTGVVTVKLTVTVSLAAPPVRTSDALYDPGGSETASAVTVRVAGPIPVGAETLSQLLSGDALQFSPASPPVVSVADCEGAAVPLNAMKLSELGVTVISSVDESADTTMSSINQPS